ncbi:MAG TPA: tetratricopeptide repeat protein [Candidatus Wunengus sp. YC65]|uniref:tetratricopeptide repeat protein n=1 Tax=Candidatus Wunengus sp. YC65 TaxID=3367701 RepID=UPI0040296E9D
MYSKITHLSNPAKRLQGEAVFAVLGLIILSFAAYLNTLSNTFVFDDVYVISGNYFIRDWKNFWGLFTSKYFAASGELSYRPVVTLSYFVDYSLWHLNPLGYHLTNVVLHTLNSVLLFFLVQLMVKNTPVAFPASLFFICHPVLSEAVNAVSYREDLLAATFFIIAFLLYVKSPASNKFMYRNLSPLGTGIHHGVYPEQKQDSSASPQNDKRRRVQHVSVYHSERSEESNFYLYPLSLLSYLFALFSKEMAITLPLLIFFFDYLALHRRNQIDHPSIPSFARGDTGGWKRIFSQKSVNIFHPPLIPPIPSTSLRTGKGGKVPSPLVGEGMGEGCFRVNTIIGSRHTLAYRILRFYLGYIFVTIFYLLVRFWWFHNPVESGVSYPQENLWFYFLTMLKVLASYLKLLFFPMNLNADYIVPVASSPWDMSCILSLLLIISIAVIGSRLFFHSKFLFFSLLWFFVALLPVLNIVPIGNIMAERYLYIPVIGFCIMGSYFITHMSALRLHPLRISVWVLTLSILFGFVWQTSSRSKDWKDEFTLWSKIIEREPNSYKAHSSLGILLIKRGQEEEGISELRKSLSINPSYPDAHNNMGTLYEQKGIYEDAAKEYRCALRLDQNLSEAHYNLGNTYLKTSNYDKAVAEYKLYISIRGDHPTVLYNLGVAYMKQGMLGESAAAFQKSLQGNPGNADVHNNLGVIFTRKGQLSNAIREFREALKYNPAHPDALSNLGAVSELP